MSSRSELYVTIANECMRQHVGIDRFFCLLRGVNMAESMQTYGQPITPEVITNLAAIVEPDSYGRFRSTPVVFQNGGSSAPANEIPRLIAQLCENLPISVQDTEEWIKQFLWVHPFKDGNGRMGWLLRTWFYGNWDSPFELPDYGW